MFVASRIVNCCRTVMPYAQFVAYAIQLGYLGYNLYHYYQSYLVQMENDRRDGTTRTFDETMELIIKPRRRRVTDSSQTQNNFNESSSDAQQLEQQDQTIALPYTDEYHATRAEDKENSGQLASRPINPDQNDSDEVIVTYDSRSEILAEVVDDRLYPNIDMHDDLLSSVSTDLESTDSNHGIVKDIYNECFICANSLHDSRKPVATLPFCMHPFHKSCLDGVLRWHQKCPICDSNMFSPI